MSSNAQRVHHFFGTIERGTTWRQRSAIGRLNTTNAQPFRPPSCLEGTRAIKRYKPVEMDHALKISRYLIRIITHNCDKSCTIAACYTYINYRNNNTKFISTKNINYLIQREINRVSAT